MLTSLLFLAFLALINCAVYECARKWGALAWLQYRVSEYLWPSRCQFCFFHRLALVELVVVYATGRGLQWHHLLDLLLYPLACAVLALFFYRRSE